MLKHQLRKIANDFLDSRYSFNEMILTLLSIVMVRLGIEGWVGSFTQHSASFYFYEFLHTTLFFYLFFIISVILLSKFALLPPSKSINVATFAFVFIIFPPIFDKIISKIFFANTHFVSYYLFDSPTGLFKSFLTFFGDNPTNGITYGTRIMIALAILALATATWTQTKRLTKTLLSIITSYIILFILSAFPSLLTFMAHPSHLNATRPGVAGFIASPTTILGNQITDPISAINIKMSLFYMLLSIFITLFLLYKTHKKVFIALLKNTRPIQTLYHAGLLITGMFIAIIFAHATLIYSLFSIIAFVNLCFGVIFAWLSTVVFNDCVDQKIDTISNPTRPLVSGVIDENTYKKIGFILFVLSIIITTAVSPYATILILTYHALSYLYNTPPLRLKRIPIVATLLAAIASFFVVAIGFITVSPTHSLTSFPPYITLLLIVSYTISLPIKDLRDTEGDRANNIYTLPVIFGTKVARNIIASGIFVSFMLSIFALGTKNLLLPALLAGTLSFWILVGQKNNKFVFGANQTVALVFIIVAIYSLILALNLF